MTQPTEGFGDDEPFVMLGEIRVCNGITVAGGHVAHSRRCPVHGEATTTIVEQPAGPCPHCGPGYRYGDDGCQHSPWYDAAVSFYGDRLRADGWLDPDSAAINLAAAEGYRKAITALRERAGLERGRDRRDTPERREERALWLRDIARMLREQARAQRRPEFELAADWLDPHLETLAEEGK